MIPFPLYFEPLPTDLLVGYNDFKLLISEYIGYGSDSSLWSTSEDAELHRRINEAYRYCLTPSVIPGERVSHVWSFRTKYATISATSDDYDYTLPTDFGSIVGNQMTFSAGSGYGPVEQTSPQAILTQRQYSNRTGVPECYAVRWLTQTSGTNQRQEVLIYPTPDGSYTLTYAYAVLAPPLSVSNPYPLGGVLMSQLMIEACKAIGEAVKNGARGDQWNIFMDALRAAVEMDGNMNFSPTVGFLRGAAPGLPRRRSASSVSYYFGPDASGTYTLES